MVPKWSVPTAVMVPSDLSNSASNMFLQESQVRDLSQVMEQTVAKNRQLRIESDKGPSKVTSRARHYSDSTTTISNRPVEVPKKLTFAEVVGSHKLEPPVPLLLEDEKKPTKYPINQYKTKK